MIIVVAVVVVILLCTSVTPVLLSKRHNKVSINYGHINEIERNLGLKQTDYSEYGVHPVDTVALCIRDNDQCLNKIDTFLNPPKSQARPTKIHKIDRIMREQRDPNGSHVIMHDGFRLVLPDIPFSSLGGAVTCQGSCQFVGGSIRGSLSAEDVMTVIRDYLPGNWYVTDIVAPPSLNVRSHAGTFTFTLRRRDYGEYDYHRDMPKLVAQGFMSENERLVRGRRYYWDGIDVLR